MRELKQGIVPLFAEPCLQKVLTVAQVCDRFLDAVCPYRRKCHSITSGVPKSLRVRGQVGGTLVD